MKIEKALKLFDSLTTESSSSKTIYFIEKSDVEEIMLKIYKDFEIELSELRDDVMALDLELHYEKGSAI